MKIKHNGGMVTFVMRTGKVKVKSEMPIANAIGIVNHAKNIVEKDNEIIVDDTYFFPAEIEPKTRKKPKADEVTE